MSGNREIQAERKRQRDRDREASRLFMLRPPTTTTTTLITTCVGRTIFPRSCGSLNPKIPIKQDHKILLDRWYIHRRKQKKCTDKTDRTIGRRTGLRRKWYRILHTVWAPKERFLEILSQLKTDKSRPDIADCLHPKFSHEVRKEISKPITKIFKDWIPFLRKDLEILERIQFRATRAIKGWREAKLPKHCGLTTLEKRRQEEV